MTVSEVLRDTIPRNGMPRAVRPEVPPEGVGATLDPATLQIVARFRLRARRRALWLRALWAQEGGGARGVITHAEADRLLDGADDDKGEEAFHLDDPQAAATGIALAVVEQAMREDGASRLTRLGKVFGLDTRELDVVQMCLAVAVEPALLRLCAYLHDDATRAWPTEPLAARLYGHGPHRVLVPESPLRRWAIVHEEAAGPAEAPALTLDPVVRDWLLGERRFDAALIGVARVAGALPPLPGWPVDEVAGLLSRTIEPRGQTRGRARVHVLAPAGSGRRTFAACVAARLDTPILVVDTDAVADEDWARIFVRVQRQAFLDGLAPVFCGEAVLRRRWPDTVLGFPFQFVIGEVGDEALPARGGVLDHRVELPPLGQEARRALWMKHVPDAHGWAPEELDTLVTRHRVTPGEIALVGSRKVKTPAETRAAVRALSRCRLGELARFVECPFGWDDLVVPEPIRQALGDLTFEARERGAFWEADAARRLFPQGQGLFVLMSGPPGTGKTMAAQVLAGALGLDLFRISLATVVSKYVGETSKNMARLLARAETTDAVLLFDEADALFGRRTEIKDAHDRFANTDTNYLLQAIESYRGLALLATNKKGNIDPAFTRRLRYVLDFSRPDAAQRRRLWGNLLGELAGADTAAALAGPLDELATHVDTTGAQIKYALLGGLFAARQEGAALGGRHLLRGLERELAKEGRALGERERERLRRA